MLPPFVLGAAGRSCYEVWSGFGGVGTEGDWVGALVFKRDSRDPWFIHGVLRMPASRITDATGTAILLEGEGLVSAPLPRPLAPFVEAMRRNLNISPFDNYASLATLEERYPYDARLVFPAAKFDPVIEKAFELVRTSRKVKRAISA